MKYARYAGILLALYGGLAIALNFFQSTTHTTMWWVEALGTLVGGVGLAGYTYFKKSGMPIVDWSQYNTPADEVASTLALGKNESIDFEAASYLTTRLKDDVVGKSLLRKVHDRLFVLQHGETDEKTV